MSWVFSCISRIHNPNWRLNLLLIPILTIYFDFFSQFTIRESICRRFRSLAFWGLFGSKIRRVWQRVVKSIWQWHSVWCGQCVGVDQVMTNDWYAKMVTPN